MRFYWLAILLVSIIGIEAKITWFRLRIELDIKIDIKCESNPNATYQISLWEMDSQKWSDQLIDQATIQLANGTGEIVLKGQAKDSTMEICVEPYLLVRTDCKDQIGAYDWERKRGDHLQYGAHPKYCIALSECPECVIYRELGAEPNPLRRCSKDRCEDDTDHCVYSDSWSHTVYIREMKDRIYDYDIYDAIYPLLRERFICPDLPHR